KHFTAQHYSFNHHMGACPECDGLGVKLKCDPDKIIVDPAKSIFNGAVSANKAIAYYADLNGQFIATLEVVSNQQKWNLDSPWSDLNDEVKRIILYGTGETEWDVTWEFTTKSRSGSQSLTAKWLGFCTSIDDEYKRKLHTKNTKDLEDLLHEIECPLCNGSRLKSELLETTFLGKNIHEISKMSIDKCLSLIKNSQSEKDATISAIVNVVLPTVESSLQTISDLGLGYLSLNRSTNSLSGGERQRITLAGQLSTHLFGVTYVMDEPTIGLDPEQVKVLIKALARIVKNGNTVVVVEHDAEFISSADYIIEMGPGAGNLGGEVIFQGELHELTSKHNSVTSKLLNANPAVKGNSKRIKGQSFGVKGAKANNLKSIDVEMYSGRLTAVTGVSGSGKSSLIKDALYSSWLAKRSVGCTSVFGLNQFEEVLLIDQKALVQNRLSTPVTLTGIMEEIKTIFSKTESAKTAGFKKADFSYQSKNGKCQTCSGHGKIKTSMDFMSDIWFPCDICEGMRYSAALLGVSYKNRSIGDVLQMTVQEAMEHFESGAIIESLGVLKRVGVGHINLGQAANTLSGGEVQRLKLATSIMKKRKGAALYLFDEPSTGLHYFDILNLLEVFESIIEQGDTVLFIEHNSSMIERADDVIRLGPGSGDLGGTLVTI
ncbi:MAG: excinuclease ABC subunit A, partial [Crocinitomicaceae bacterium]